MGYALASMMTATGFDSSEILTMKSRFTQNKSIIYYSWDGVVGFGHTPELIVLKGI
jgi:hypothetical protein